MTPRQLESLFTPVRQRRPVARAAQLQEVILHSPVQLLLPGQTATHKTVSNDTLGNQKQIRQILHAMSSSVDNNFTSSQSPSSLSPSITPSTFHSRLKTHLFHKSFPP